MATGTLSAVLEREHRDIDGGIEAFTAAAAAGEDDGASLATGSMPDGWICHRAGA